MQTSTPAARDTWSPASFYRNDGGRIQCTLCPHDCRLGPEETGRCGVRKRSGDRLLTATFTTAVRATAKLMQEAAREEARGEFERAAELREAAGEMAEAGRLFELAARK